MLTRCWHSFRQHHLAAAAVILAAAGLGACGDTACDHCLGSDGDHVQFLDPEVTADHPGLVLLSAWRNGRCQSNQLCAGSPDVYMGDVRWGPDDFLPGPDWSAFCKKKELVMFQKGKAPQLEIMPPADLPVTLASAVVVPVKVWVAPPFPDLLEPEDRAKSARGIYETLGTGIDLQIKPVAYYSTALPTQGVVCHENAATFAASESYDPTSLNVYYVEWLGYSLGGQNCYDPDPAKSHQEIMFVTGGASYSAVQMAHEIGHALGLLRSVSVGGGVVATGDLFDEALLDPYLTKSNLMYSGGDEGTSLTIGQIYRMHFDKLSWLNRTASAHLTALTALAPQYPLECQNDPATGDPCPPLALHPVGAWP